MTAPLGREPSREAAWLIEREQVGDTPTAWWDGRNWQERVCDAVIRFTRFQDADRVIHQTLDWGGSEWPPARAVEHIFIDAIPSGPDPVRAFGLRVLEASRKDMGDVDGGDIQDWALELGVLVQVPVTEPCGENCRCAEYGNFPQECIRLAAQTDGTP